MFLHTCWILRVLNKTHTKTQFGQFLLVLRFQLFEPVFTKRYEIVDKCSSKTFEDFSFWKLSKWCCVLILQLPRQRGIVQRRFYFRSTCVEWKQTKTFGQHPFVLNLQCFGATILWTERKHIWKFNTTRNCPNVFLCLHTRNVERKQNRRWTTFRCLGNCYVQTQQHLEHFHLLTHTQRGLLGLACLLYLLSS